MTVEALVETFPWVDIDQQWFLNYTAAKKERERKMKDILKMAKKFVKQFNYQGFEDLTLEDMRVISVETGQPFGVVAMMVYGQAYYD